MSIYFWPSLQISLINYSKGMKSNIYLPSIRRKCTKYINSDHFSWQSIVTSMIKISKLSSWGIVQGKYMGFHLLTSGLAALDSSSLITILNKYDLIYQDMHTLRGANPDSFAKMYVSSDHQYDLYYNNFKNGYPILVDDSDYGNSSTSYFLLNYTTLTIDGQFSLFASIGANFQDDSQSWYNPFFPKGITKYIFAVRAMKNSSNIDPLDVPYIVDGLQQSQYYLLTPDYTIWRQVINIAIVTYIQIVVDFGWSVFQTVLGEFQLDEIHPSSSESDIDLFWYRVSVQINRNMTSFLQKWGVNYTTNYTNQINNAGLTTDYVELNDMFVGI